MHSSDYVCGPLGGPPGAVKACTDPVDSQGPPTAGPSIRRCTAATSQLTLLCLRMAWCCLAVHVPCVDVSKAGTTAPCQACSGW